MADTDTLFLLTLRNHKHKLWEVGNLKFFCMIDIYEMAAIFQYFMTVDTDILFPLTFILGHLCVVTFLHLENQRCEFSICSVFPITHPMFHFNI